MMRVPAYQLSVCFALVGLACAPNPPRDFAPDLGLVSQIRQISIIPRDTRACPGEQIHVDYEAILADGSHVPFARSYDKRNPPALHVQFLERRSPDAVARDDGDWVAERNPLATVATGFRLTATLRDHPTVTSTAVLPPSYDCLSQQLSFSGMPGIAGGDGGNGPDVTVRLEVRPSPFYDSVYVAGVEVEGARPFYVVAPTGIARTEWLTISSRGGSGGDGSAGLDGTDGTPGAAGCPGQAGGQGTDGSNGSAGGNGGHGGHFTIVVPPDRPQLAALVKSDSWGGSGGSGGRGGRAGRGGSGGQGLFDPSNQPCSSGADGMSGHDGLQGSSGWPGSSGPRTTVANATGTD